ncbi:MAG: class I SAM-dependent methyltransferase [Pseudomonadales bacterium]|nr:class I SAM-dependent methyltransferase [Pseudomonadales bacterium]
MPEFNERYHKLDTAQAYEEKIKTRRKLSTRLEFRMVGRSLDHVVGDKILDCPCGTGRIDELLRERFSDITGVDGAEAMFEVYMAGNPDRKGQVADIFNLPFADNEFDWTLCHRLFHHFKNDADRTALVSSLNRVSKNGFCFYAWVSVPFSRRGNRPGKSRQTVDVADIRKIVDQAGAKIDEMYYAAWPFSPKVMVVCSAK